MFNVYPFHTHFLDIYFYRVCMSKVHITTVEQFFTLCFANSSTV